MLVTASKIFAVPESGQSCASQSYPDMIFIVPGQVQTYNLFLIIFWLTLTLFHHISYLFSSQDHFHTFISFLLFSSNLLNGSCKHSCEQKGLAVGEGGQSKTQGSHRVSEMGDETQVLM